MSIEDVELTQHGEIRIVGARIRIVANEGVDGIFISASPILIEVSEHRTTVYDVTIVEVMIVIIALPEILRRILHAIETDNSSIQRIIQQLIRIRALQPRCEKIFH